MPNTDRPKPAPSSAEPHREQGLPAFISAHRQQIQTLAVRHGARNLRLFGSCARGDSRPDSDVDFLVEAGPQTSSWFPAGMVLDLQEILGRKVDVVTEAALHPLMRAEVLAQAIPL